MQDGSRRGGVGLLLGGALLALCAGMARAQTAPAPAASAGPVRIYAAGSLSGVMPELVAAAGLPADTAIVYGPAGLLRRRLQGGERADLFASADVQQPRTLVAEATIPFARNRMCVLAPARLGLTPGTVLERMLSPDLRLATSTPGADPGGDYAQAVFARADRVRPGAEAVLAGKALRLLGGPDSMAPQAGHSAAASVFLAGRADMLLYYCSGAEAAARELPSLAATPVPPELEVGPVYGLALLSDRAEAGRLALLMVSERGQAILARGGLLPLVPGPAS